MPRLRRNRYLTCFYCGRRTSTLYDSRTTRFDCPSCDATNYLDENGDVADPPVATDQEATPIRPLAVPRPGSPAPGAPAGPVFCERCLHNQHLLRASLAQYLPDPEDPDYAERERGLQRFRENQERLYPQICAECEPRVRQRLEEAAYTAKTDALRHMIDRSAIARGAVGTRGWPELLDFAGRALWIGGSAVQLAWHAAVLCALLSEYTGGAEVAGEASMPRVLRAFRPLVGWFLSQLWLLRWSTVAGILGIWWNPRFAMTSRGLGKQISGMHKWYMYQIMTTIIRVCLWQALLDHITPKSLEKRLEGHFFAACSALFIFILAPRSIRLNTAPLFRPSSQPPHPYSPAKQQSTSRDRDDRPDETKAMFELLDEVLRSPSSPCPPSPPLDASPSLPRKSSSLPMGHAHTLAAQSLTTSLQQIDSLHLSSRRQNHYGVRDQYDDDDEMDWSPTPSTTTTPSSSSAAAAANAGFLSSTGLLDPPRSKYRAFSTVGQRASQPFGAAPVTTEPSRKGAFWYKVPPAPTTPAQRLFNPPSRYPRPGGMLGGAQAQQRREIRFRGPEGTTLARERFGTSGDGAEDGGGGARGVSFAEPSFFAEEVVRRQKGADGAADPRDGLTGLFGSGLTLAEEEEERRRRKEGGGGWLSRLVGGGREGEKGKKR